MVQQEAAEKTMPGMGLNAVRPQPEVPTVNGTTDYLIERLANVAKGLCVTSENLGTCIPPSGGNASETPGGHIGQLRIAHLILDEIEGLLATVNNAL